MTLPARVLPGTHSWPQTPDCLRLPLSHHCTDRGAKKPNKPKKPKKKLLYRKACKLWEADNKELVTSMKPKTIKRPSKAYTTWLNETYRSQPAEVRQVAPRLPRVAPRTPCPACASSYRLLRRTSRNTTKSQRHSETQCTATERKQSANAPAPRSPCGSKQTLASLPSQSLPTCQSAPRATRCGCSSSLTCSPRL